MDSKLIRQHETNPLSETSPSGGYRWGRAPVNIRVSCSRIAGGKARVRFWRKLFAKYLQIQLAQNFLCLVAQQRE